MLTAELSKLSWGEAEESMEFVIELTSRFEAKTTTGDLLDIVLGLKKRRQAWPQVEGSSPLYRVESGLQFHESSKMSSAYCRSCRYGFEGRLRVALRGGSGAAYRCDYSRINKSWLR